MITGSAGTVVLTIGFLVFARCVLPLVLDAAQGVWRPSRVSYGGWTAACGIGFAGSLAVGAPAGTLLVTGGAAVLLGAVLAATFTRAARAAEVEPPTRLQRWVDRACLVVVTFALGALTGDLLGVFALGVWFALAASIVADFVACIPTFRNAWRGEEPWLPYGGLAANSLTAFLVADDWALDKVGWVSYSVAVCLALMALPYWRGRPVDVDLALARSWGVKDRWPARRAVATVASALTAVAALMTVGVLPQPAPAAAEPASPVGPAPVALPTPAVNWLVRPTPPRFPLRLPGAQPCRAPHTTSPSRDGVLLAVVCFDTDDLWILQRRDTVWEPVRAVRVGSRPQSAAWAGNLVLTADNGSNTVSVVDTTTGGRTAQLSGFPAPVAVTVTASGEALVTCLGSGDVRTIDMTVVG